MFIIIIIIIVVVVVVVIIIIIIIMSMIMVCSFYLFTKSIKQQNLTRLPRNFVIQQFSYYIPLPIIYCNLCCWVIIAVNNTKILP